MKNKISLILSTLFVAVALFSLIQEGHAASVSGASIQVNGKDVAGYAITWDGETRANLIEQLSKTPLVFERDYKLPLDAKNPNFASLQGRVSILSYIRGEGRVVATVKALRLVKRNGKWFVDAESLKRALGADQKNQPEKERAEQDGADQSATATESKSEGKDIPQPESKSAPR